MKTAYSIVKHFKRPDLLRVALFFHEVRTNGREKIPALSKIFARIIRQTIEYVIYYSTVIHFSSILAYNYNFDGLIRALYRSLEAWAKVRKNNTNETIKLIKKKLTYLEVLCSIGKGLYTGNKQSLELSLGPLSFSTFRLYFALFYTVEFFWRSGALIC